MPSPSAMGTRLYIFLWMLVYLAPILGWLMGGLVTVSYTHLRAHET